MFRSRESREPQETQRAPHGRQTRQERKHRVPAGRGQSLHLARPRRRPNLQPLTCSRGARAPDDRPRVALRRLRCFVRPEGTHVRTRAAEDDARVHARRGIHMRSLKSPPPQGPGRHLIRRRRGVAGMGRCHLGPGSASARRRAAGPPDSRLPAGPETGWACQRVASGASGRPARSSIWS